MIKSTPLQILIQLLGGPNTNDVQQLTSWLAQHPARSAREAEVREYLLAASQGGQLTGTQTQRGSLKYILWWLRDHADSLYAEAATAVIRAALNEKSGSLATIADRLVYDPRVGGLVQQALQGTRSEDLEKKLIWEDMPRGRVAWNRTAFNLAKIAFKNGAEYYAAISNTGACLMAARGRTIEDFPLKNGWVQPYPNLVVLQRQGTLVDESIIRTYLKRQT